MSLIEKEVEVGLNGNNIEYYKNLGYEMPMKKATKNTWYKYHKEYVVDKSRKIRVKIEHLQNGSRVKVSLKCDECGKITKSTYVDYLSHNHNGKTYCNKCSSKVLCSGEKAYNYRHDLTKEERENGRDGLEKTEFVKKVMARDNYTCQCCNKPLNHDGVVHHLNGWDNFKEQRYDVQNGITLCETCHKNFHSKYGYGNNTKEQFEEWYGEAVELVKYEGKLTTARQIYCIEEDKVYNGALEIEKLWNITHSNIYAVGNHKRNYKKGIIKGKHLLWLDEAIKKGYITK